MQPPTFVLNCLGVPRLLTPGGQEVRVKVKKHLALLVVLAVDGGKIRRERLVSLLWPAARPDRARGSVATAISYLRAKLGGDAIEPGRDWVQLRRGHLALDLDRLVAGEVVGDDFTPPLDVDAFLAGFEIEQVPEFDEWRERQHARLLPAVEKGLIALADHARRSGDLNELGRHADRMLQLNDLSEAGIRARMEAYALSGDRITAIRVYDEWTERLRIELRAVPTRSVEELANRLRRKGWDQPVAVPAVAQVQTEQWRNQHFVGRSREYRRLYEIWEGQDPSAQHVLITGDSGVGKTTLADRFATAVALQGGSVARTRCFELESSIPYAMLRGALEPLVERPGASATGSESLAELGRIIPDIRRCYPHLPNTMEAVGESARLRLADAAQEFLCSLSEERPVLIVIDDINQSDEASVAVLHFLLRRLGGTKLMVLLTWRSGVSPDRRELSKLRDQSEQLGLQVIDVEPMSSEDSAILFDMLCNELGASPTTIERHDLIAAAGGLPLAIELLLRDWRVNGLRSSALAISAMTSEVQADPDSRYHKLAEGLIGGLPDDDKIVAHLAAILDRRVGDLEIYEVASIPKAVTLRALTHMLDRRALRDTPTGLEWINPSVRAHAYLSIPHSMRRLLHGVVLEELLRRSERGLPIPGLEIAWHSFRAGRATEGVDSLNKGAAEALRAGAPHEAERALLTAIPELSTELRNQSALLLAEALQEQGRFDESLKWLNSVSSVTPRLGSRVSVLTIRVLVHQCAGASPIPSLIDDLAEIATEAPELGTRVLAISVAAAAAKWCLSASVQQRLLSACVALPPEQLEPEDLLLLWGAHAKLLFISRDLLEAERLLEKAVGLSVERRIRNAAFCSALNGLGAIAVVRGDYQRALDLSVQLHAECLRQGAVNLRADAAGNTAMCLFRLGRYSESMEWIKASNPTKPDAPLDQRVTNMLVLAEVSSFAGEPALTRESATYLEEAANTADYEAIRRQAAFGAANAWYMLGEHDRALSQARRGLQLDEVHLRDFDNHGYAARWACLLALQGGHDESAARRFLRRLLDLPLDRIDRATALAGIVRLGDEAVEEARELREILGSLPAPVADQFLRYGILRRAEGTVCPTPVGDTSERATPPNLRFPPRGALRSPSAEEKAVVGS